MYIHLLLIRYKIYIYIYIFTIYIYIYILLIHTIYIYLLLIHWVSMLIYKDFGSLGKQGQVSLQYFMAHITLLQHFTSTHNLITGFRELGQAGRSFSAAHQDQKRAIAVKVYDAVMIMFVRLCCYMCC